mgnify:CR=1 FL=1
MHNQQNNQQLNEGLRATDLKEMVHDVFEVDSFRSKMGEDQDIVVLGFHVQEKNPAIDLMEFIEDNDLVNPIIIGHSMGGKTVMQFGLSFPGIAQKIIVVDIAPKFYPVHHTNILAGLNSVDLSSIQSRNDANEHMKRFEENEGIRQFLLKNLYRNSEGLFAWKINLPVITKNIDVVGHELFVKNACETTTFFIKGADSHYIQPEDERYIAEIFPNFELIEIPHAGHWVQADQPETFIQVLKEIL